MYCVVERDLSRYFRGIEQTEAAELKKREGAVEIVQEAYQHDSFCRKIVDDGIATKGELIDMIYESDMIYDYVNGETVFIDWEKTLEELEERWMDR